MPVLVDYRCTGCGILSEHWESSPPSPVRACDACGADARRLFAAVGLAGASVDTRGEAQAPGSSTTTKREPTLCRQFPQIPALCHMTPSAQRRWVATFTRDTRAQEREIERQQQAAEVKPPVLGDAIQATHQH